MEFLYRKMTIKHSRHTLYLLLRSILQNPTLALLVRHLVFDWKSLVSTMGHYIPEEHLKLPSDLRKVLPSKRESPTRLVVNRLLDSSIYHATRDMASFSIIAKSSEMDKEVIAFLQGEHPDSRAFFLLIYMLRNLRTLKASFPSDIFEGNFLREMFGGNILPKLQSLKRMDGTYSINVRLLFHILLTPSLNTVTVTKVVGYEDEDYEASIIGGSSVSQYFGTSRVTFIGLDHSYLPASALAVLCKLPKVLRELRYGHDPLVSRAETVPIESIGKAIRGASSTLERLAIRYNSQVDATLIGSLRAFKALKLLVLPPNILLRQALNSNPPFATLLPISLEKLIFSFSEWPITNVIDAVHLLLQETQAHFPKLKMIALWTIREFNIILRLRTLLDFASSIGVQLGIADARDPMSAIPLDSIHI